ncbi:MAG: SDR family oxidoreductase [Chitinivibrionales bacterium]|nr:SDR family oxidoreductase [Chitinivibrionales bacterium]
MKLRRAAVLITSGTKRLGLAFAKESLALGFDVLLHYRTHTREARRWLSRHADLAAHTHFIQKDITPENARELISESLSIAPRLVGLVNNASSFSKGALQDIDHFAATIRTNALVPAALTSAFAAAVTRGWVINVTDAHISAINIPHQNYRVSKMLLTELTRQQAALYAPKVRVNAIAPGPMLPAPGDSRERFESLAKGIPLGRTGSPNLLRPAFSYLVTAEYVTGEVLHVDGGWHLRG